MVTHAELVKAFGSRWVETMPPETAERHFADPEVRRLLTEVGLPLALLSQLYFGDISTDPPETIGQVLLPTASNRLPAEVRDDIMILCGMGGYACISRTDYRIYWYERGTATGSSHWSTRPWNDSSRPPTGSRWSSTMSSCSTTRMRMSHRTRSQTSCAAWSGRSAISTIRPSTARPCSGSTLCSLNWRPSRRGAEGRSVRTSESSGHAGTAEAGVGLR